MRQEGRRAGAPACPLGGRPQTAQPSPRTPTSFLLCRSCCPSCCCPCCSGGRQAAQPDGCRVLRQGVCAVCQRHPEQHRGCAALVLRCAALCVACLLGVPPLPTICRSALPAPLPEPAKITAHNASLQLLGACQPADASPAPAPCLPACPRPPCRPPRAPRRALLASGRRQAALHHPAHEQGPDPHHGEGAGGLPSGAQVRYAAAAHNNHVFG